jgi:sulfate permease, SulP family
MSEHRWLRPLPEWLVSYRGDWLRPDIIAGLTTGAVIIPKAMAYAMMAGLPVQVGLYTALVPMVIYAVLGTSRVLSVSTSTTVAILTAAQLAPVAPSGNPAALLRASATLALLVGAALCSPAFSASDSWQTLSPSRYSSVLKQASGWSL